MEVCKCFNCGKFCSKSEILIGGCVSCMGRPLIMEPYYNGSTDDIFRKNFPTIEYKDRRVDKVSCNICGAMVDVNEPHDYGCSNCVKVKWGHSEYHPIGGAIDAAEITKRWYSDKFKYDEVDTVKDEVKKLADNICYLTNAEMMYIEKDTTSTEDIISNTITVGGRGIGKSEAMRIMLNDKELRKVINCAERIPTITEIRVDKPATIVFFSNGDKVVVKTAKRRNGRRETFDAEKGIAMALNKYYLDKLFGKGTFNDIFRRNKDVKFIK